MTAAYNYRNRLQPVEFLKAYSRAVWKILHGQEVDEEVFLIVRSLNGKDVDRLINEVREDAQGREILLLRQSLLESIGDWDRLESLPVDTLGHQLWLFFQKNEVSNLKFAKASKEAMEGGFYSDDEEFMSKRIRDLHDVWHVLADYSIDRVGENAMLAFSFANTRIRGIGIFAAIGLCVRVAKNLLLLERPDSIRMVINAYQRGQRASRLALANWEELLQLPLEQVRRQLEVEPAPRNYKTCRFQPVP